MPSRGIVATGPTTIDITDLQTFVISASSLNWS